MGDILLVLLGLTSRVWVGYIDIDRGLDEGDEGHEDGEREDGETLSAVLTDVIPVYVVILLLTNEQNVALERELRPGLQEALNGFKLL